MDETALVLRAEDALGLVVGRLLPRVGLNPSGLNLALQERRVRRIAQEREIDLTLEAASTGRPRRMDYERLALLLATGATKTEAARELGVTRHAVSKAIHRRRDLRRVVNRLNHATAS